MKRFWLVLLSLGLVAALSMPAFAVTGDMAGQYYVKGTYVSNPSLLNGNGPNQGSWAWTEGRLQVTTNLKIVDGLKFSFRFTALENIWGANRKPLTSVTWTDPGGTSQLGWISKSGTNSIDSGNFDFDRATLDFSTKIGQFIVGNQGWYTFGTEFFNDSKTRPGIRYINNFGPAEIRAWYRIKTAGDMNGSNLYPNLAVMDNDNEGYGLSATTKFKGGDAGIQWEFTRWASARESSSKGWLRAVHLINPYVRAKVGIVNLEAEGAWLTGDFKKYEDTVNHTTYPDIKADAYAFGANAKVNLGPAYVGVNFEYYTGDDPATADKMEGGMNKDLEYSKGQNYWGDFPGIMFTDQYYDYLWLQGNLPYSLSSASTGVAQVKDNCVYWEVNGGFKASPKLDVAARFFIAKADKIPGSLSGSTVTPYTLSKDYGKELDVKASYKIFDNLTYNVAAAYLWIGDYFKGTSSTVELGNNYLLTHWLELNF